MASTSCKRSSRLTGRKGPNVVGNLHTAIQSPRVKPEGDRGKKMILSLPGFFFFFVIPRLDRGICKGDVRLKAEHDKEKKPLF